MNSVGLGIALLAVAAASGMPARLAAPSLGPDDPVRILWFSATAGDASSLIVSRHIGIRGHLAPRERSPEPRAASEITALRSSDCPELEVSSAWPPTTPPDPETAAPTANAIAIGRVEAREFGFLAATPVLLTAVQIETVLKGAQWLDTNYAAGPIYLPSSGNFALGDSVYCTGRASLDAEEGQEVLLLLTGGPYDASRRLAYPMGFSAYAIDRLGVITSKSGTAPARQVIDSLKAAERPSRP